MSLRRPGLSASTSAVQRKQKVILVERITDVESLVDVMDEATREEPKVKAKLRKVKKFRPENTESTVENAQAWLYYYRAMLDALRDRQRAEAIYASMEMAALQMNAILRDIELKAYLQEEDARRMEEEVLIMLLVA